MPALMRPQPRFRLRQIPRQDQRKAAEVSRECPGPHLFEPQHRVDELLWRQRSHLRVEAEYERLLDPERGEQLQPAFERRQQADRRAEHRARVRVERDRRGGELRRARFRYDPPVAEMDAVERPDRDGTTAGRQLVDSARDLHVTIRRRRRTCPGAWHQDAAAPATSSYSFASSTAD